MEQGRIVILTGTPGTGKTTVASILARETSLRRSVLCAAREPEGDAPARRRAGEAGSQGQPRAGRGDVAAVPAAE